MKSENDGRDHQIAKELCKEKIAEKKSLYKSIFIYF